jgi:hypothetical protein
MSVRGSATGGRTILATRDGGTPRKPHTVAKIGVAREGSVGHGAVHALQTAALKAWIADGFFGGESRTASDDALLLNPCPQLIHR